MAAVDVIGNRVSLGLSAVLPLVLPALTRSAAGDVIARTAT
jgi:hypothetical protein